MQDIRKPYRRFRFAIPFFIVAVILLAGLAVMILWNAVLPALLHVGFITYWRAVGVFVLCKILFGNFRGRPGNSHWRGGPPWRQKWMNMSDEEKTKFREEWKKRCNPRTNEDLK